MLLAGVLMCNRIKIFRLGMLRKLLGWSAEHAITRKQFGKSLMEFELMQEKFAKMACTIYAMESMAYLTSGNLYQFLPLATNVNSLISNKQVC